MSKVVVMLHVSADGVVGAPAWPRPSADDEHAQFQLGLLFASRALLLGRVTYQEMAAAWPQRDPHDAFTDRVARIPKFVVSGVLEEASWNAVLIRDDVTERVAKLKREPGLDLLVYGSLTLVDHLFAHGLVDVLRLCVHPHTAGPGRRMLASVTRPQTWTVAGAAAFGSGAVVLDYRKPTDD
ncbi:dihydrofolate reductase family protein [Yinghuangia soli]|uniref:Dihydrofolate reductase family protein n=1 Tax=Yinghuangia soli TaxID=2908204 RepID=A0AA41Q4N0_9ACTN|nr:dihydrofolate reductase family protein [Yinghuangia soli]MCF2530364.1 dihydrofolate reductase family protein [Yinghuangia soli]